jgi:2-polyprenyl-3-methyl-5-hydroxy-6-metoxy-1,4-benzoquinol methylase
MKKIKNKNLKTIQTLSSQINGIDLKNGGIIECIKFENKKLLSKISLKNKDVIEFGCGVYPASLGLKDNNMPNKYIATDASKNLIFLAKKIDVRPTYKVLDLEKIKFSNNQKKFDVIILKGVLHHVEFPEKVLIKISKFLKENGCIIVSEPNLSSLIGNFLKWFLNFFFNTSMEDSPYGQLEQKKIRKAFSKANLFIVKEWYSSLIAFTLSGDFGRKKILPDNKILFKLIIFLEQIISNTFHLFVYLARILFFKVNFMVKKKTPKRT